MLMTPRLTEHIRGSKLVRERSFKKTNSLSFWTIVWPFSAKEQVPPFLTVPQNNSLIFSWLVFNESRSWRFWSKENCQRNAPHCWSDHGSKVSSIGLILVQELVYNLNVFILQHQSTKAHTLLMCKHKLNTTHLRARKTHTYTYI